MPLGCKITFQEKDANGKFAPEIHYTYHYLGTVGYNSTIDAKSNEFNPTTIYRMSTLFKKHNDEEIKIQSIESQGTPAPKFWGDFSGNINIESIIKDITQYLVTNKKPPRPSLS